MSAWTDQQRAAIKARGNVLVAAGAGTGKTSTVTARCLDLVINEGCRLDEILMVTFTEAAAAEMRERLRKALHEQLAREPSESTLARRLAEEIALLDTAPISTLHSFCLDLVRRNFHALGLDPQFTVLDEQQTKPLIHAVLDELFERHYSSQDARIRELVTSYGNGREDSVRDLVVSLHRHTQALAAPDRWFAEQAAALNDAAPTAWRDIFLAGLDEWARLWLDALATTAQVADNVAACRRELVALTTNEVTLASVAKSLDEIIAAGETPRWPKGQKTKLIKPIEAFFDDAQFLSELARDDGAALPLDWAAVRGQLQALMELAQEFTVEFAKAKRELGGIDFADQEQLALRLLYDAHGAATPVALACREQFRFVFVDECQDINAAQDAILRAVSRESQESNRFLVGDVKQSIYRFRLADPRIFQNYQSQWGVGSASGAFATGRVLPLSENFRSREGLLSFINPLFRALMRPIIGGLNYDSGAELKFGDPENRAALAVQLAPGPRAELHIIAKASNTELAETASEGDGQSSVLAELQSTEREARLIARRLKALKESGHPIWNREHGGFVPAEFRDMVVLMRGVAGRAEIFAKAFHQAGVPLHAERAGFLDSLEITDLLGLLRLLDNPLQDVPLLAVLHSPLVGMTTEELTLMRLAQPKGLLWFALRKFAGSNASGGGKAASFLAQYSRWRELIRHASLTHCLESALTETHYEALLLADERGAARVANVRRLVELARRFDPFQREGLFRFLRFIAEQEEAEVRHQPALLNTENAVRLMTIHASKGLEFPVVVLAGLGNRFNTRELGEDILLNDDLGLCPKIVAPQSRRRYPSIAHWVAAQRERRALLGEEMRLLYVALTRARDTLILIGTATKKDEPDRWKEMTPLTDHALVRAGNYLDWLRLWFAQSERPGSWTSDSEGADGLLRWRFYDAQDEVFLVGDQTGQRSGGLTILPPSADELTAIKARLAFRYANAAATVEPAKTSVSILRRRASELDDAARPWFATRQSSRRRAPATDKSSNLSATEIGDAHHAFMQFVELDRTGSELDLRNEAERLRLAAALASEEVASLNFRALASFWQSEVGQAFRAMSAGQVHRELPFTARMTAKDLRNLSLQLAHPGLANEEFLVIQGIVDLAAITDREIWLLDFKTDQVKADDFAGKVKHYAPQLQLYALALSRIYRRPVARCWLHFLMAGETRTVPRNA